VQHHIGAVYGITHISDVEKIAGTPLHILVGREFAISFDPGSLENSDPVPVEQQAIRYCRTDEAAATEDDTPHV
jgi:hypothetical protein